MIRRGTGKYPETIFAVLIACVVILLHAAGAWAAAGKISGIVVDKKTKDPLIGCPVQVEGTTLGSLTDLDGRYTILSVPLGVHSVIAKMVGFTTVIQS